jgi:hypothetical protein
MITLSAPGPSLSVPKDSAPGGPARQIGQLRSGESVGKNQALADEACGSMLGWHHSGFSTHNEVRVAAEDTEGRKKFAS